MKTNNDIRNLLAEFADDLSDTSILWQLGALFFCLGLAWLITRQIRNKWFSGTKSAWKGGLGQMVFPITALLLLLLARAVISHWFHHSAFNLAVPLLISLALIRFTVYVLHRVFAPSNWLFASERAISIFIWGVVALHISGLLPEILEWLDKYYFPLGKQKISLLTIMNGIFSTAIVLLLALWISSILEKRIMDKSQMDMSLRVVMVRMLRPTLTIVGVLIALPLAGIDLTVLSVFGGALGIGIGFGLQKITSNYISGFIILLDRSVRIGDLITVGDRNGTVTNITNRYLVLKGMDGTEAIIPNETMITSTVLNHSYSNHELRMAIPVQISYDSPLEKAMQIMLDAANHHTRVLQNRHPKVFLKNFGESGIDLELSIWIADPEEGQQNLRSDINLYIWEQFQREGIDIPYPQRVVKLIQ